MLDYKFTMDARGVIQGFKKLAERLPEAAYRGLRRIAVGVFDNAHQWLSGAGGGTRGYKNVWSATGYQRVKTKMGAAPGGYPVPVRTGHLRRSLAWLAPGASKSGDVGTVSAGRDEFIVFNSAAYASDVFLGKGRHAAFGPRDALKDALDMFNQGANAEMIMGQEVQREINRA